LSKISRAQRYYQYTEKKINVPSLEYREGNMKPRQIRNGKHMRQARGGKRDPSNITDEALTSLRMRSVISLQQARKHVINMDVGSPRAREAFEYYAMNWNDITHPGIIALSCEAMGGTSEIAVPLQVATLLLTAATDIHDDILDQSKTKNGKSTMFGKYGEGLTLLLGDALLLKGFLLLYDCARSFSAHTMRKIMFTVENSFFEFGRAHLFEIDFKQGQVAPEKYVRVLEGKGSTIELCARLGALAGGASNAQLDIIGRYGRILGTLIAIREEFIDVFEVEELRDRIRNNCLPLPIQYAFHNPEMQKLLFDSFSTDPERSTEKIVTTVFADENVKKLIMMMEKISQEALNSIDQLKAKRSSKRELRKLIYGTLEGVQ
jgi:geranylgeranyl pyrophosphate synthase